MQPDPVGAPPPVYTKPALAQRVMGHQQIADHQQSMYTLFARPTDQVATRKVPGRARRGQACMR
jgi:hypothetical protein